MTTLPVRTAHNGFALPALGLGTYRLNGDDGAAAIAAGIDAGYRLVDSAFNYENEGTVGRGVADAAIDRAEIIVTTKLPGRHHPSEKARTSIEESRFRLGADATDLHLIHWPNPIQDEYVQAWAALVDAQQRGVVRQIGVSNFLPEHLERIERETGVRPVVNQIELHPYFQQKELVALHWKHGITTQAWSPIGGITSYRESAKRSFDEPVILTIGEKYGKSAAQVMLRWHIQNGVQVIPKSTKEHRIAENFDVFDFELTPDEVTQIDALDTGVRGGPEPDVITLENFGKPIPEA